MASTSSNSAIIDNILDIRPDRGVLSSIASQLLQVTLEGPSLPIDSFCAIYTTTSGTHTWRVEAATVTANLGTSNLIDSGTVTFWPHSGLDQYPYRHAFYRNSTSQTCGAVRITISGLPQFYVGHIKVGLGFQPDVNFSLDDFALGWEDPSKITSVPGIASGPARILAYPRRQVMTLNCHYQTYTDALIFVDHTFQYGRSHPLFVVLDPDDTTTTHYKMINALIEWESPPVQAIAPLGRFNVPMTLREYGA